MALKCYKSVKKIRIFRLYARQRILRMATHNTIIPPGKLQVKSDYPEAIRPSSYSLNI